MAARILAKAGKHVVVLEARNRCGGRIHTGSFLKEVELGAEFIHGGLPVTLNLLREAHIAYYPAGGEMWHYKNGRFYQEHEMITNWDLVIERLSQLEQDCSIADFLEKEFPGDEYQDMRKAVWRFVSGYDTADPHKASAFALRKEWESEDEDAQHRIRGGYGTLIKFLEEECKAAGGRIHLNSAVKTIRWRQGNIKAITTDRTVFEANKVIIALPLGVLQADVNEKGAITFDPPISQQNNALHAMGFGAIIKILLKFDELFWEDEITESMAGKSLKNMSFMLSDEVIPTWWTQAPQHSQVLTGWLGGPAAAEMKDKTDQELLQLALQSLGKIFSRDPQQLHDKLVAFNVVNWTNEPYTRGSYSYDTLAAPASRKLLNQPVSNTLFFAGEYLYDGPAMGTVEAALTNGLDTAKKTINADA